MATLEIKNLHVTVAGDGQEEPREILKGVDLTVKQGETHALMGPNGSGKSTLAYSIAGHPRYTVTEGSVTLDGEDVLAMTVDERARAGLFLAMQYPVEVPGVSVANFLRTAVTAVSGEAPKLRTWIKELNAAFEQLAIDPSFKDRSLNEGFSGRREEALRGAAARAAQAEARRPRRDRLRPRRRRAAHRVRGRQPGPRAPATTGTLLITHYTRILRYIQPDHVHVFVGGRIVAEGGPELADTLEAEGYEKWTAA